MESLLKWLIAWVSPPLSIPGANGGLVRDSFLPKKYSNPGGDWNPGQGGQLN